MKTYGVLQPACGPHFNYIFTLEHSTPEDHLTADFSVTLQLNHNNEYCLYLRV